MISIVVLAGPTASGKTTLAIELARRLGGEIVPCAECERAGWYRLDELEALGVNDEIRDWSRRAVESVAARLLDRSGSAT